MKALSYPTGMKFHLFRVSFHQRSPGANYNFSFLFFFNFKEVRGHIFNVENLDRWFLSNNVQQNVSVMSRCEMLRPQIETDIEGMYSVIFIINTKFM